MNIKSFLQQNRQHGLAVGIFLLAFVILFHPALFGGKTLQKHDIQQWRASAKAIEDYRDRTGEEPLWTNAMFSGMPATLVSTLYSGDLLDSVFRLINFSSPYSLIFLSCICFYILLQSYKVDPLVAVIGAFCYSYSSHLLIGMTAGHTSRIAAIAFFPLVVAGFNLIFNGKYRWGFIATALGLAFEIKVNHLQITYYLALALVIMGVFFLIHNLKQKDRTLFTRKIPILLVAVVLAVGANIGRLWNIVDYGKYSTRGKSELVKEASGLERGYIFEYSNSIAEPLVLFIPNIFGGASQQELSSKSNLAEALRANGVPRSQVNSYLRSVPTYWGQQRISAPYYVGAIAFFLAVLGILVLDRKLKIWLIIVTALGIVLSWGDNFSSFNYFLFNYFPGYDKFRSVTFTIILSIFGISVLASLGLQELLQVKKNNLKPLLIAAAATGGVALLIAIFAGAGRYAGPVDETLIAQQTPQWFIDALREDRAGSLRKDALRTAFYVFAALGIIYLVLKEKLNKQLGLLLIVGLTLVEVILIDKRYLNSNNFVDNAQVDFSKSAADDFILGKSNSGQRVLNLLNPFNDATPSYYHESIGGYHGAKLGRYRDLIENSLTNEIQELIGRLQSGSTQTDDLGALNMLNTTFFKFGETPQQVIENPSANGNAWFVNDILEVSTANDELAALGTLNTKSTAVIDVTNFPEAAAFQPTSTNHSIQLTERDLNVSSYQYSSDGEGLVVFSEIYYPKGWIATIDDQETSLLRANYTLRALKVPAGQHTIKFEYKPRIYRVGNTIMMVFGILLYVSIIGAILYPVVVKRTS